MARLPGKKFDTWHYEKNKQEIDVPVRVDGVTFWVIIPELDISARDETPAALKKKVFALLDEKLALEWERYLYITVSGGTEILRVVPLNEEDSLSWEDTNDLSDDAYREAYPEDHRANLKLEVEVEAWGLCTTPTGQKLGRRTESGHYTHKEWPSTGKESYRRERGGDMRALVPDTPATREAINLLSRDLQRLNDRLQELFAPERVSETLALAGSGVKLLASPKGDK